MMPNDGFCLGIHQKMNDLPALSASAVNFSLVSVAVCNLTLLLLKLNPLPRTSEVFPSRLAWPLYFNI